MEARMSVAPAPARLTLRRRHLLLAVAMMVVFLLSSAGVAHAYTAPKIVRYAPTTLSPSGQLVVEATARPRTYVQLKIAVKGHGSIYSPKRYVGSSGRVQFVWRVPSRVVKHYAALYVRRPGYSWVSKKTVYIRGNRSTGYLSGTVTATRLSANEPPRLKTGLGGIEYPAYGSVLISGEDWFNGMGVDVKSNGPSNDTGTYQCVELVQRFINARGYYNGLIPGNANEFFDNAPTSAFERYRNGTGYVPVPGDIIVEGGGDWGHVCIVDHVQNGLVWIVEQNASSSGWNAMRITGSTIANEYYGMGIIGVLHAKGNGGTVPGEEQYQPASGASNVLAHVKVKDTESGFVQVSLAAESDGTYKRIFDVESEIPVSAMASGTVNLFGSYNGAPQLGYIQTSSEETSWVVVKVYSLSNGKYVKTWESGSDFKWEDNLGKGSWSLYGAANGHPMLSFIKTRETGTGVVEVHNDTWDPAAGEYRRTVSIPSDFPLWEADNGVWRLLSDGGQWPRLAFIKLKATGTGTVEVFVQERKFDRYEPTLCADSNFDLSDASKGSWNLIGFMDGFPTLGFIKYRDIVGPSVEVHMSHKEEPRPDYLDSYIDLLDAQTDFPVDGAADGFWQLGSF